MIYDGSIRDTTNYCSNEYITVNSCNIRRSGGRAYTVIREQGRVDYHILYVMEGECSCFYEGATSVMTKGNFVIYLPGEKQRYSFSEDKNTVTLWVHFSGRGIKEILNKLGLGGGIYRTLSDRDVESCFEKMIYHYSLGTNKSRVCAEGELIELLSLLSRDDGEENSVTYSDTVAKMLKYIHSNWQKELSVADISARMSLSESRAAHIFKEAVGKGIHQYIMNIRLSTAKELLVSTDMSVSEIGEMVGFHDALYFSRAFKSETGMSPRAFRMQK